MSCSLNSGKHVNDSKDIVRTSSHQTYPEVDRIETGGSFPRSYDEMYRQSIDDNEAFWREQTDRLIEWFHSFDKVMSGGFEPGDVTWFNNGKLNVSHNYVLGPTLDGTNF